MPLYSTRSGGAGGSRQLNGAAGLHISPLPEATHKNTATGYQEPGMNGSEARVLDLQGGGTVGSSRGETYQALAKAAHEPGSIAGI